MTGSSSETTQRLMLQRAKKVWCNINSYFETYKSSVRPHGFHINKIASYTTKAKICTHPYEHHGLLHWKCELCCCDKLPSMVIPSQEENIDTTNTCPKMHFHVYINVHCCTMHGRRPY